MLYFIMGIIVGGMVGLFVGCAASINRINKLQGTIEGIRQKGYDNYMSEWGERVYKGGIT